MRYAPKTAFRLSHGKKRPRVQSKGYLDFVRSLPCVICHGKAEAAHIRFTCLQAGKPQTGAARKPDDCWAVPLCHEHHMGQHLNAGGEEDWWARLAYETVAERRGILPIPMDPIKIAALLWLHFSNDDHQAAELVCLNARML